MPKPSRTTRSAAPAESEDMNIIRASIIGDDASGKNNERGDGDNDDNEGPPKAWTEETSVVEDDASGKNDDERSDDDDVSRQDRLRHRLQQATYYAKIKSTKEGHQQFNEMHRQRTARSRAKSQHKKLLEVKRELRSRLSPDEHSFIEADAAQYGMGLTRAPDFHLSDREYKEDIRAFRLENKILKYETKLMKKVLTKPALLDQLKFDGSQRNRTVSISTCPPSPQTTTQSLTEDMNIYEVDNDTFPGFLFSPLVGDELLLTQNSDCLSLS